MEYNGNMYYYQYNLQGDVTGLYDSNFNKVVYYLYDSWGKLIDFGGSMANTVGTANPFRYRGYYYDEETGFYYLNSRYYDPETGRFINADGILGVNPDMTTYNLFAYCGNNPTNNHDTSGERYERDAGCFCGSWVSSEPNITRSYPSAVGTVFMVATTIAVAQGLSTPAMRQEMFALRRYNREQAKAKEKSEVTPAPPPTQTVIYRYGGTNPGNFVPSPRDVANNSGLSFLTTPPLPGEKAAVTTIEALNATGVVRAYQDKPGHVRVDPVIGTLTDWRAGGSEHPCTIAVKSVVVKWDGGN